MPRPRTLTAVVLAATLTLAACGSDPDEQPPAPEPVAPVDVPTPGATTQDPVNPELDAERAEAEKQARESLDKLSGTERAQQLLETGGSFTKENLQTVTAGYALAVNAGDYGAVYDLSCPGIRGTDSRAEFAEYMQFAPQLKVAVTSSETKDGPFEHQVLPAPGVNVDKHALTTFEVLHGSEDPETSYTAVFVHSDQDGWSYCGALPPM
jgi:hypothetical protein